MLLATLTWYYCVYLLVTIIFLGAHLLLACKDVSKGEKVKNEILQEVPSCTITIYEVNLSSLSSVRALVNNIKSSKYTTCYFIICLHV